MGTLGLTVTFLILTLIFVGMVILERYILKVYAQRDFILKDQIPFASTLFLGIMFGISLALIEEFIAVALVWSFSNIRFLAVYLITAAVYIMASIRSSQRKRKKKVK
jgi:hypothetical protein